MKIIYKETIASTKDTTITKIKIHSPLIAQKAKAGQFVVLMVNSKGERIPLTIVEKDIKEGSITLIFQEVGLTTKLLGALNINDSLYALSGPFGHPTHIKNYGSVIVIGGGVGIAEIYPVIKEFKKVDNKITTILGARTSKLLILEEEIKELSDEFYVATDDGSYGKKGFVTDILNDLLINSSTYKLVNLIYAVGPIPMMKMVSEITKKFNIKTIVSLNALMVDATGMCGSCRVKIANEVKFSCVDGPEFDAHLVDWDELIKRSRIYIDKEREICRLNLNI